MYSIKYDLIANASKYGKLNIVLFLIFFFASPVFSAVLDCQD